SDVDGLLGSPWRAAAGAALERGLLRSPWRRPPRGERPDPQTARCRSTNDTHWRNDANSPKAAQPPPQGLRSNPPPKAVKPPPSKGCEATRPPKGGAAAALRGRAAASLGPLRQQHPQVCAIN